MVFLKMISCSLFYYLIITGEFLYKKYTHQHTTHLMIFAFFKSVVIIENKR